MPISFVPNTGQIDSAVRFHARAMEGNVYFTDREVLFALPDSSSAVLRCLSRGLVLIPR